MLGYVCGLEVNRVSDPLHLNLRIRVKILNVKVGNISTTLLIIGIKGKKNSPYTKHEFLTFNNH